MFYIQMTKALIFIYSLCIDYIRNLFEMVCICCVEKANYLATRRKKTGRNNTISIKLKSHLFVFDARTNIHFTVRIYKRIYVFSIQ